VERRSFASVPTKLVDQVWKRSGQQGVYIRALGREPFDMVRLPTADTLTDAKGKTSKTAGLAYGIIPTHNGFAIRCKPEDKVAMEKALMPDYAAAVGDDLLSLPKKWVTASCLWVCHVR